LALARKYRPQTFDELAGQEFVATSLKNAISLGRIYSAYLFTGAKGVGKTSVARILAKALNCENLDGANPCNRCDSCLEINEGTSIDVAEIDAASKGGVDDARLLSENVAYLPMKSKRKVYIIDECHMLSTQASNALLKTLEEPPEFVNFIFATTEAHKVLSTIKSRCQRYDFKKINNEDMAATLIKVFENEKLSYDKDAISLIVRNSEGSMRDALSISDQLAAFGGGKISLDAAKEILGSGDDKVISDIFRAAVNEDEAALGELLSTLSSGGASYHYAAEILLRHTRNKLLLSKGALHYQRTFTKEELDYYDGIVASEHRLFALFQLFSKLCGDLKYAPNTGYAFEFGVYKAAALSRIIPLPQDSLLRAFTRGHPECEQKALFKSEQPAVSKESKSFAPPPQAAPAQTEHVASEQPAPAPVASVPPAQKPAEKVLRKELTEKEKIFDRIVSMISADNKSVASMLSQASLADINDGVYRFNFSEKNRFNYTMMENPANRETAEGAIKSLYPGFKALRLTIGGAEKNLTEKKEEIDLALRERMIKEAAETPLIDGILNVFGLTEKDIDIIPKTNNGEKL
jgi:DNA polymerase-3 subunit gamma/tau